jgi:MOSC domain-containing protein YiiM
MALPVGTVVSLSCSASHSFSKQNVDNLKLIAGEGAEGDAHRGVTVKHRSRVAADPTQPNLRQVHLIHAELFEELAAKGFVVKAGDMGENITTTDIDLLGLPRGSLLQIGDAILRVTGLRNPCKQLNEFAPGLMAAVLDREADGSLIRKAGIMAIVVEGGAISTGDRVHVTLPPQPYARLERV